MDNQNESTRENYFLGQMMAARTEEMTNMLRCVLCQGLLRFAHTLVECGHTFCQQCIFAYIRGFKGKRPEVKCPQCHAPVETPFSRSIMRDVFKQSLVDSIDPSFAAKQKLLVQRITKLFPNFNLNFLLEEFSFNGRKLYFMQWEVKSFIYKGPTRKKSEKSRLMAGLANVVKDKLGISFQAFAQQIRDDESYQKLVQKMSNQDKSQCEQQVIEVKPRTERDYRFVGISSKMRLNNAVVQKIQKYLEKKLLLRLQQNQELAQQLMRMMTLRNGMIDLYLDGRVLQQSESLLGLATCQTVYYTLKLDNY